MLVERRLFSYSACMRTYDVAGYHIRGLIDGLRNLQLDVDQILRDAQVDRAMLDDTEVRFAEPLFLMLWMHAQARYGKPTFGLDLAGAIGFGKLELIDYLVAGCPTIGTGIDCLVHHAKICSSGFTYRLDDFTHDGVSGKRLMADHHIPVAMIPFSMSEYVWSSFITRIRRYCTKEFQPILWLRQRSEASPSELIEHLGRIPEIAEEEGLFIPEAQWNLENPRRDPMLHQLLLAHARDVASRLPEDGFSSALQGAIVSAMHQGDPSIGRVATRLGLTTRTLQRRLEADGILFQNVLDEIRRDMALRYLENTQLSLTDISNLLAYSDATAFGRAFRRWMGRSPAAFRQEHRHERATNGAVHDAPRPSISDGASFGTAADDAV